MQFKQLDASGTHALCKYGKNADYILMNYTLIFKSLRSVQCC